MKLACDLGFARWMGRVAQVSPDGNSCECVSQYYNASSGFVLCVASHIGDPSALVRTHSLYGA
jgi:hypothetical protein